RPFCRTLGMSGAIPYFNSGVMLIDLVKWRLIDAEQKLLEYLDNNADKVVWADQCVLNAVFEREWQPMSNDFNCHGDDRDLRRGVAILHYAGSNKPWLLAADGARSSAYWRVRQKTPYALNPIELRIAGLRASLAMRMKWTRRFATNWI